MRCKRSVTWRAIATASIATASIATASIAGVGCAHGAKTAPSSAPEEVDDGLARASRENAALRRRVDMLEDRVLHMEQAGVTGTGATAAMTLPDGRDIPVVRLQPSAGPSVSARTWQSATAPEAVHIDVDAGRNGRRSKTLVAQPASAALDSGDELGGFTAGAPSTATGATASSYRLVGSRLAELSKSERRPVATPRSGAHSKRGVLARYQAAMATLKEGRADLAEGAFASIAADHPRHDYADNALYWKGESAYDQRHYADALAAFTQVVERYGGGDKAPDALLKIGLCYNNLGDVANGRDVLTELITAYPRARASGVARVKLAEMSAGASRSSSGGHVASPGEEN